MIKLNDEEINEYNSHYDKYQDIIASLEDANNEDIKDAFNNLCIFYFGLYDKYHTKFSRRLLDISFNYDGYVPGKNDDFIGLYSELIFDMQDYIIDKPIISIQSDINGNWQKIKEYEDGTIETVKEDENDFIDD